MTDIAEVNGVAAADIAEVNGVAAADIAEVNGLALVTSTPWTDTKSGLFDSSASVNWGGILNLDTTAPRSVSHWVKLTSVASAWGTSISCLDGSNMGWVIAIWPTSNKLFFQILSNGASQNLYRVPNTAMDYSWQHWVFTYDGSRTVAGIKTYINGGEDTYSADNAGTPTNVSSTTLKVNGLSGANFRMDELAIWDKALSSTEAAEIYNSGNTFDLRTASCAANLEFYVPFENSWDDFIIPATGTTAGSPTFSTDHA